MDQIESKIGENLMFNRILIKQSVKEEPKHRRALFRVRCKVLGKVCKVIVDSGSTNNIISEEAVRNLKLTRIPHTSPYKVTWLNKGQSMLVNEQTFVEFSIGGYKDKILCDVLPMDACHLLLGRPWQFDRKMIYDGGENSISFKKDDKTFKIQSLTEDDEGSSRTPSVLLNTGKEFLHLLHEEEIVGCTIFVKPKEEESKL